LRPADVHRAVWPWARRLDRPLPWRGERDPYRVLVSEVMLQQTQASRVAELYPRFLDRFPTAEALACADGGDVLRAWENLGYNRRALNLWRTARAIVDRGSFPRTIDALDTLPGIGAYTARAVASFAFDVDVAAVDANVRRVVTRLYGDDQDVQARADGLVPHGRAAAWNQALIDLGAEVCRARGPRCEVCPLRSMCAWKRRPSSPRRRGTAIAFEDTSRFARGRAVAALRRAPMTVARLAAATGLERSRLDDALDSLVRDQIVHRSGRRVVLGPAT